MTNQVEKHASDCMVCGGEIKYDQEMQQFSCHYCGSESNSNTYCEYGHFVCDTCHAQDAISIIKKVCLSSTEKNMFSLLKTIRSHPSFPLHGPEHHAMVSGIILTAYRNSGGQLAEDRIIKGIDRGGKVPGGYCGFLGACGAALAVGNAFAIIMESTPLKPKQRQIVLKITSQVLQEIAKNEAARCCQRESLIALRSAARLSEEYLDIKLIADDEFKCEQSSRNKECIRTACPFWCEE